MGWLEVILQPPPPLFGGACGALAIIQRRCWWGGKETERQTDTERRRTSGRGESMIRRGGKGDVCRRLSISPFPQYLHRSISPSLSPCMYQRLLKISQYRVIMTSYFFPSSCSPPRPQHQIPSASTTGRASVSVCICSVRPDTTTPSPPTSPHAPPIAWQKEKRKKKQRVSTWLDVGM